MKTHTEIAMRVARALSKRNMTISGKSIEAVAEIVDEVAQIQLLLCGFSKMSAHQLIDKVTSEAAKDMGTF